MPKPHSSTRSVQIALGRAINASIADSDLEKESEHDLAYFFDTDVIAGALFAKLELELDAAREVAAPLSRSAVRTLWLIGYLPRCQLTQPHLVELKYVLDRIRKAGGLNSYLSSKEKAISEIYGLHSNRSRASRLRAELRQISGSSQEIVMASVRELLINLDVFDFALLDAEIATALYGNRQIFNERLRFDVDPGEDIEQIKRFDPRFSTVVSAFKKLRKTNPPRENLETDAASLLAISRTWAISKDQGCDLEPRFYTHTEAIRLLCNNTAAGRAICRKPGLQPEDYVEYSTDDPNSFLRSSTYFILRSLIPSIAFRDSPQASANISVIEHEVERRRLRRLADSLMLAELNTRISKFPTTASETPSTQADGWLLGRTSPVALFEDFRDIQLVTSLSHHREKHLLELIVANLNRFEKEVDHDDIRTVFKEIRNQGPRRLSEVSTRLDIAIAAASVNKWPWRSTELSDREAVSFAIRWAYLLPKDSFVEFWSAIQVIHTGSYLEILNLYSGIRKTVSSLNIFRHTSVSLLLYKLYGLSEYFPIETVISSDYKLDSTPARLNLLDILSSEQIDAFSVISQITEELSTIAVDDESGWRYLRDPVRILSYSWVLVVLGARLIHNDSSASKFILKSALEKARKDDGFIKLCELSKKLRDNLSSIRNNSYANSFVKHSLDAAELLLLSYSSIIDEDWTLLAESVSEYRLRMNNEDCDPVSDGYFACSCATAIGWQVGDRNVARRNVVINTPLRDPRDPVQHLLERVFLLTNQT